MPTENANTASCTFVNFARLWQVQVVFLYQGILIFVLSTSFSSSVSQWVSYLYWAQLLLIPKCDTIACVQWNPIEGQWDSCTFTYQFSFFIPGTFLFCQPSSKCVGKGPVSQKWPGEASVDCMKYKPIICFAHSNRKKIIVKACSSLQLQEKETKCSYNDIETMFLRVHFSILHVQIVGLARRRSQG